MKKLIAIVAVVAAAAQLSALAADDHVGEVLYWQIPTGSAAETVGNYSYAQLYAAVDGQGNVSLDQGGWMFDREMMAGTAAEASLSGINGLIGSFYVEYFNEQNEKVGFSAPYAWTTLAQGGFIGNNQSNPVVPNTGVWQPNFVVPEPTSGLLMLLGLAGLALRRRTMKAAALT